jgi:hypothetical protein
MTTNITDLPFNSKTELPQRDIPRETQELAADPQTMPNYTPPKQQDYIEHQQVQVAPSKMDRFLEDFKMPILVSVLYLMFNLPIVQLFLTRMAPTVYMDTSTGLLARSISFGILYYAALMMGEYLNKP